MNVLRTKQVSHVEIEMTMGSRSEVTMARDAEDGMILIWRLEGVRFLDIAGIFLCICDLDTVWNRC